MRRARQQARNAVFMHDTFQAPGAFGEFIMAQAGEHPENAAPLRAQAAFAIHISSRAMSKRCQAKRRKSSDVGRWGR